MFGKVTKAKEIGSLTDYLVNNQAFRHLALGVHKSKKDFFGNVEAYLDKELLGKTQPAEPLNLNTRGRNSTTNSSAKKPQRRDRNNF